MHFIESITKMGTSGDSINFYLINSKLYHIRGVIIFDNPYFAGIIAA